ncbi:MAG: transglutaminase domain-containing protein [Dehalococcoidales bacterium]|nr:transglutaminase domain-containing protein [Dehalococcoidales bacterium]
MEVTKDKSLEKLMLQARLKSWLGSWSDWLSIICLFLVLEIAVRSIEQARWITPQPSLTLVLLLAILAGWLQTRSRLPGQMLVPLALVSGVLITLWQAANLLPSLETSSRLGQLIAALQSWWQAVSLGEPSGGTVHFAVFLIFSTWMMSYLSTWFLLRRQNAWVAVSLSAVAILVNLSNLPREHFTFFFVYLLAVMLLLGQVHLSKYNYWFRENGIDYSRRGIIYFTFSLLTLSVLAVSLTSLIPEIRVNRLETLFYTKMYTKMPWRGNIEEYVVNTLANIQAKQPFLRSRQQKELFFGNFEQPGDEIHFKVTSERSFYLRTRMYDVYTSQGWKNSDITEYFASGETARAATDGFAERQETNYTVLTQLRTNVLLTAGEFISSDIWGVTRVQIGDGDAVTAVTPNLLRPGQQYTVTASISTATPDDLSKAGENYPELITDYYLQLPPDLPERVRQLSQMVTVGAKSPYDKVIAIKRYLTLWDYILKVEAAPEELDGVDYFLFNQEAGNCLNFASAMVTLLRADGVPARLHIGYRPGEWDEVSQSSIIRARNYHSWPAVYFPGYGWIEFESVPVGGRGEETDPASDDYLFDEEEWEQWLGTGGTLTDEEEEEDDFIGGGLPIAASKTSPLKRFFIWSLPLVAIGFMLWLFNRWLTRFSLPNYVSGMYGRLCFLASLIKLRPEPEQTPLEYGAKLASAFPQQAEALDTIVQAYVESRFSRRKKPGIYQRVQLQKSWRRLYPTLLKRLFFR